jgi:hypothetical protein
MAHPLAAKEYLKVTTNLSLEELSSTLRGTVTTWTIKGFDAARPAIRLIECENAAQIKQRIHDLFLEDRVHIEEVSELVNGVMDMAATHALVCVPLWLARQNSLPDDTSLATYAANALQAISESSGQNLFGEDYNGYLRIYSRTFIEASYRTLRFRQQHGERAEHRDTP